MYCVDMFKWPFPSDIFERLEALESTPSLVEMAAGLAMAKEEIVVLRGAQDGLHDAFIDLSDRHKQLVIAVGEGIERVERDERRIKAAVQRARQKLKDNEIYDEGLEAEADGIRLADGNGIDGVPAVPAEVAAFTEMERLTEQLRQRGLSR